MRITIIAGARPNFIKIAPIIDAIQAKINEGFKLSFRLVHTGQHFDKNMSDSFFQQLGIPHPDVNLECGGGTQAEQTANIMIKFERDLLKNPTDLLLVVGDVTSTMACTIVAKKLNTKVAHVEAGIRSGDMKMPEEINRIVTDSLTDYFFTTSIKANENLLKQGIDDKQIFFVGNTMIDTLIKQRSKFIQPEIWSRIGLEERNYIVLTLHRPANVDGEYKLKELLEEIAKQSRSLNIVFPVHPRTAKKLTEIGFMNPRMYFVEPLSYLEFNYLVEKAKCVITDSGGITEETTVLGVPCITLRDSTERPETVAVGTNELIGTDSSAIAPYMDILFSGKWKKGGVPELWDGKTSMRIINILNNLRA
jgi:UDP-N-acetylglucosamine 2-epimerase (non-hydrolysing)